MSFINCHLSIVNRQGPIVKGRALFSQCPVSCRNECALSGSRVRSLGPASAESQNTLPRLHRRLCTDHCRPTVDLCHVLKFINTACVYTL